MKKTLKNSLLIILIIISVFFLFVSFRNVIDDIKIKCIEKTIEKKPVSQLSDKEIENYFKYCDYSAGNDNFYILSEELLNNRNLTDEQINSFDLGLDDGDDDFAVTNKEFFEMLYCIDLLKHNQAEKAVSYYEKILSDDDVQAIVLYSLINTYTSEDEQAYRNILLGLNSIQSNLNFETDYQKFKNSVFMYCFSASLNDESASSYMSDIEAFKSMETPEMDALDKSSAVDTTVYEILNIIISSHQQERFKSLFTNYVRERQTLDVISLGITMASTEITREDAMLLIDCMETLKQESEGGDDMYYQSLMNGIEFVKKYPKMKNDLLDEIMFDFFKSKDKDED